MEVKRVYWLRLHSTLPSDLEERCYTEYATGWAVRGSNLCRGNTLSGTYPASYSKGTELLSRGLSGRVVKLCYCLGYEWVELYSNPRLLFYSFNSSFQWQGTVNCQQDFSQPIIILLKKINFEAQAAFYSSLEHWRRIFCLVTYIERNLY
jgi:hypothetical protein